MKPGATLGLSHGFLEGYLKSIGKDFPKNINVIMVAPKGMGPSVRRLYVQGRNHGGSGINTSVAVHQDIDGNAMRIATGWSVAIGAPVTFQTTLPMEWRSDLTGERGILLGGLWGMLEAINDSVESVYQMATSSDHAAELAFRDSALVFTSLISPEISRLGLKGFWAEHISANQNLREAFSIGGFATYDPFLKIMQDIYKNVSSGQEILDVIKATDKLKEYPMPSVEEQPMWQTGKRVRESGLRATEMSEAAAFVAGAYTAGIMAQFRVLRDNGHCISEIVNESLIEGTDSLTPYMDAHGVAHMVDNCSITARLGTRRYGPIFKRRLLGRYYQKETLYPGFFKEWRDDPIHEDILTCYKHKPKVSIVTA